jgi:CRP/FNR family cyclic AMP-dependent transcriptional regulator
MFPRPLQAKGGLVARTPYVRLLELLPELAADLDRAELAEARRLVVAPLTTLPEGQWSSVQLRKRAGTKCVLGCLVVEGLVVREVVLGGRAATQLLGPGDLLAPAQPPSRFMSAALRFSVTEPVDLAVLDEAFAAVTRRWPSIAAALIVRAERQAERAAFQQAISQLPRAEQRIVALLWHLGDRWGTVADGHVAVPVSLRHEGIARLVGARRPTISAALGRLEARGLIIRQLDGTWLLSVESRELLDTAPPPSPTPEARLITGRARSRRGPPMQRARDQRPL